jgi:hypothetical protein
LYIQLSRNLKRCDGHLKDARPIIMSKKTKKRVFDAKLRKVGNSHVITIPKELIDRFELEDNDFLALEIDPNEIKKTKRKKGK